MADKIRVLLNEEEVLCEIARISSGEVNEVTLQYANELRKKVKVITSIFNSINCECLIIIVSNNNDSIIEKQIQEFCEGGALWDTDQIYD